MLQLAVHLLFVFQATDLLQRHRREASDQSKNIGECDTARQTDRQISSTFFVVKCVTTGKTSSSFFVVKCVTSGETKFVSFCC